VFSFYKPHQSLFVGIEIDDEELALFVERVDKDNNGVITFEEWRDFLLLYPHEATIENIYHYLERVCLVDIGEQTVIPEGISKHIHASRYLIAGAVAGAKGCFASTNNTSTHHASSKRYMERRWLLGIFPRQWAKCYEGGP
jgi:hypothetical protein